MSTENGSKCHDLNGSNVEENRETFHKLKDISFFTVQVRVCVRYRWQNRRKRLLLKLCDSKWQWHFINSVFISGTRSAYSTGCLLIAENALCLMSPKLWNLSYQSAKYKEILVTEGLPAAKLQINLLICIQCHWHVSVKSSSCIIYVLFKQLQ